MAKIIPGSLIGEIRGAVGSVVFRKSNGTAIVQAKQCLKREATEAQNKAIRFSQNAATLWATRTERDNRSWENWAIQHPITTLGGAKRAPALYPTFAARYCKACWTWIPPTECRIIVDPVDNDTLIRMEGTIEAGTLTLKVYKTGLIDFFSAGWFRLVSNPSLKNSQKKYRPAWYWGFNTPIGWTIGTDSYGTYIKVNLELANEYIYNQLPAPCYVDFHVIVATALNATFATRDILGIPSS